MNKMTKFTNGTRNAKYVENKEMVAVIYVIVNDGGTMYRAARATFMMGRSASASKVYCSVWFNNRDRSLSCSGHGTAGGYGYHKTSAALSAAFESAGIELESDFSGHGSDAMKEAMFAVVKGITGEVDDTNLFYIHEPD